MTNWFYWLVIQVNTIHTPIKENSVEEEEENKITELGQFKVEGLFFNKSK